MAFVDNEEIKSAFSNKADYKSFIDFLFKEKLTYSIEYEFLNFSSSTWDTFISKSALVAIAAEDRCVTAKKIMDNAIKNYITKKIANNKTAIMDNLLKMLYRKEKDLSNLLLSFFRTLDRLGITLNEEYYRVLKANSSLVQMWIKYWGLENSTLNEIIHFLEEEFHLYNLFKSPGIDMHDCRISVSKILEDFSSAESATLVYYCDSELKEKLRFLTSNFNIFEKVYQLCLEVNGAPIENYYRALANFSIDDLQRIKNDYLVNRDYSKDRTYLFKILQNLKRRGPLIIRDIPNGLRSNCEDRKQNKEKVKPKRATAKKAKNANTKKENMDSDIEVDDSIDAMIKLLTDENRNIINILLKRMTPKRRRRVEKLLNEKEDAKTMLLVQAKEDLIYIQDLYIIYFATERKPRNRKLLQFYDSFSCDVLNDDEKRGAVNFLIGTLPLERQDSIWNYLLGYITKDSKKGEVALADIKKIREEFTAKLCTPSSPRKCNISSLYDRFPDKEGITPRRKKIIVDFLISGCTPLAQKSMADYLNRLVNSRTSAGRLAHVTFTNLKKKYMRYLDEGISRVLDEALYDSFPNYSCIQLEEKRDIVNILFSRQTYRQKKDILDYVENKISPTSSRVQKALSYIAAMKSQYKDYIDTSYVLNWEKRTIFDIFPEYKEVTTQERNEIIAKHFRMLSKAQQADIKSYINGETDGRSPSGKKAMTDIYILQMQVRNYIDNNELIRYKSKSIYDLFPNYPEISAEKKREIVDLMISSHLSHDRQADIAQYIRGEIKDNDSKRAKVSSDLFILKEQYCKRAIEINRFEKSFYDKFPDHPEVTFEKKKQIIYLIFTRISNSGLRLMSDYDAKRIPSTSKEGQNAITRIAFVRKTYENWLIDFDDSKIISEPENLYDRFPDIEGIDEQTKKALVDEIISLLPVENQRHIEMYVRDQHLLDASEKDRVKNDIAYAIDKYIKHCRNSTGSLTLMVAKYKGIEDSLRMEICEGIIGQLSDTLQEILKRYLLGYIDGRTKTGSIAKNTLLLVKKQYNLYVFTHIVNVTWDIIPESSMAEAENVFMAFDLETQKSINDMFLEGVDAQKIAVFKEKYDEKLREINESDYRALEDARKRKDLVDVLFLLKQRFTTDMYSDEDYRKYEEESMRSIAMENPDFREDEILKQFIIRSERLLKEMAATPEY